MKQAVLNLQGANCAACVFAIEHLGRKVNGVSHIRVHAAEHKVYVRFSGDRNTLDALCAIVAKLGHSAAVDEQSIRDVPADIS